MMSFPLMSAQGKSSYELRASSIEADSVVLCFYNNTVEPVYLFDSYIYDSDMAMSSYLYRYNRDKDIVKLSFLPLQQFTILPLTPERMVVRGKGRYFRGKHQTYYHFTKIEAGDSLAISIAKKALTSDRYYYDVDLKEYTFLEKTKDDENEHLLFQGWVIANELDSLLNNRYYKTQEVRLRR